MRMTFNAKMHCNFYNEPLTKFFAKLLKFLYCSLKWLNLYLLKSIVMIQAYCLQKKFRWRAHASFATPYMYQYYSIDN